MANKELKDVRLFVDFLQAENRENIVSNENISTSFGKIAKVIADLEDGKFSNSAKINDVEVTGDLDSATNLKVAGKIVAGTEYTVDGTTYTAGEGAEVFNNYRGNVAVGDYSHAEGIGTIAFKHYSHAEGYHTKTLGYSSHAEGNETIASGGHSHAEGSGTTASATCAHAEGSDTIASAMMTHAGGYCTIAASYCQTAIGRYNIEDSSDKYAFIIGNGNVIDGRSNALAVTWDGEIESATGKVLSSNDFTDELKTKLDGITTATINDVEVTGDLDSATNLKVAGKIVAGTEYTVDGTTYTAGAGAEVFNDYENNAATGLYSHAEGYNTIAMGQYSHAGGYYTVAASNGQTVIGRHNIEDSSRQYAFIIGNGTHLRSSNALAVAWNGEIVSATGKVLSSNDFTDEEKTKLASITNPMIIKGTVASATELPTTAEIGWIYFVGADGSSEYDEYVYTENSTWEVIGHTTIDMSGYVQTTDIATTTSVGLVKPDGVTLTANTDGVLSVVVGTEAEIDAMFADADWEY